MAPQSWMPGDPISVTFSEQLDCRKPFSFGFLGNYASSAFNFSIPPPDVFPIYEGNTITLAWNMLQRPQVLQANRNVMLQLFGAVDAAGNVQSRVLNMSFTIGTVPTTVRTNTQNIRLTEGCPEPCARTWQW
jgi:hypothetical protein